MSTLTKELDLYQVTFRVNAGLRHKPLAFEKLKEYLEQRSRKGIEAAGFQPEGDLVGDAGHGQFYCIVPERDSKTIRQVLYEFGYKYLNRQYVGSLGVQ